VRQAKLAPFAFLSVKMATLPPNFVAMMVVVVHVENVLSVELAKRENAFVFVTVRIETVVWPFNQKEPISVFALQYVVEHVPWDSLAEKQEDALVKLPVLFQLRL